MVAQLDDMPAASMQHTWPMGQSAVAAHPRATPLPPALQVDADSQVNANPVPPSPGVTQHTFVAVLHGVAPHATDPPLDPPLLLPLDPPLEPPLEPPLDEPPSVPPLEPPLPPPLLLDAPLLEVLPPLDPPLLEPVAPLLLPLSLPPPSLPPPPPEPVPVLLEPPHAIAATVPAIATVVHKLFFIPSLLPTPPSYLHRTGIRHAR